MSEESGIVQVALWMSGFCVGACFWHFFIRWVTGKDPLEPAAPTSSTDTFHSSETLKDPKEQT